MIYKYSVLHDITLRKYASKRIKDTVKRFVHPRLKPIDSDLTKIFVVGCGHSGTTLMASAIGKHPELMLVTRESMAFLPERGLGVSHAIAQEWVYFAQSMGKSGLVEKTPKHIHVMHIIREIFPDCHFIVLKRNPLDCVASMCQRFSKYEHQIANFCALDYSVERWLIDTKPIAEAQNQRHTHEVFFERLVSEPESQLRQLCDGLGLKFRSEMLSEGSAFVNSPTAEIENMRLRINQTSKRIEEPVIPSRSKLKDQEFEYVRRRTSKRAGELGYIECSEEMTGRIYFAPA